MKVYGCLCELSEFTINGISARYEDFGDKDDMNQEDAEDYCCGDMRFERKPETTEILEKYKITKDEYNSICVDLEDKLSFGSCGWCS